MNKKIIIGMIIVAIIIIGIVAVVFMNVNKQDSQSNIQGSRNTAENENSQTNNLTDDTNEEKTNLVLYFSATGNTERIAKYIQEITNSDITEIIPKEKYTSEDLNYNNDDTRANKEQNDDSARPEIENDINIDNYDVIYLGYPIWWGTTPKIILTLLDNYDLSGKTVITFCTSGGSGISQSMNELKSYNNNVNWIQGERFSSSSSKGNIESWLNELNLD